MPHLADRMNASIASWRCSSDCSTPNFFAPFLHKIRTACNLIITSRLPDCSTSQHLGTDSPSPSSGKAAAGPSWTRASARLAAMSARHWAQALRRSIPSPCVDAVIGQGTQIVFLWHTASTCWAAAQQGSGGGLARIHVLKLIHCRASPELDKL